MKPRGIKGQLLVQDTLISFTRIAQDEFISLTDIARVKNSSEPKDVVKNWLRSRSTIDFLGLWEKINNPNFKGVEFDAFKNQAGTNSFTLSPSKWIEATDAIGLRSTAGRTGGTYAHKDAGWICVCVRSRRFECGFVWHDCQRMARVESLETRQHERSRKCRAVDHPF